MVTYYLMLSMMKVTYASYMQRIRQKNFENEQRLKENRVEIWGVNNEYERKDVMFVLIMLKN